MAQVVKKTLNVHREAQLKFGMLTFLPSYKALSFLLNLCYISVLSEIALEAC
jgi:hypothetical protein